MVLFTSLFTNLYYNIVASWRPSSWTDYNEPSDYPTSTTDQPVNNTLYIIPASNNHSLFIV